MKELLEKLCKDEYFLDTVATAFGQSLAEEKIKEKDKRIEKLEELLKECYKMLAQYHIENSEPTLGENIQLLTKIEEVLK